MKKSSWEMLVKEKGKKGEFPGWVDPMLATLTKDTFSDPDWIYERKLDGMRVLVFKNGRSLKIFSRNQKDQTERFPELAASLGHVLEVSCVVDGEIVAFDGNITSFSLLQNRMHVRHPKKELLSRYPVFLYLFDMIYWGEYDISGLTLSERKAVLRGALKFDDPIRFSRHKNENGEEYLKEACSKGWEGLIAKDRHAQYVHSRSNKWLKFKCVNRQEFVIGGFTEPQGSRQRFGALLVGYYDDDRFRYAGKVGAGFNDHLLEELGSKMERLETEESPFGQLKEKRVHWIKPRLVAEIGFTEWTPGGKLRHPRFIGLRVDKEPEKVVREL